MESEKNTYIEMPKQDTLDKYTITRTLGSGTFAKVKLAQDQDGKQKAIKVFDLNNKEVNMKRQMELI